MKNAYTLIAAMAAVLFITIAPTVQAQPGQGPGMRQGMGPGYGAGMGPGYHDRSRGFAFNNTNTRGWSLMTIEEQAAHRDRMWSAKSYEECKAVQREHHEAMLERAKAQGKTLPMPRWNACDRMKAGGLFK